MVDARTTRPADGARPPAALDVLLAGEGRTARARHVHRRPASTGKVADWPSWSHAALVSAWQGQGIEQPWVHQVEAADHAWNGRHVVVSTGTASGKSLAFQLPALNALLQPTDDLLVRRHTALYLSPTKALAGDQLSGLRALIGGPEAHSLGEHALDSLRPATYDGDTLQEERRWVRDHANYVLTNPDLLHYSLLPGHQRWAPFLRGLRFVVVDECHRYRGVFGAQVAAVLRRLRRVAARYGAHPVFVLASATASDPGRTAGLLTGLDVVEVTEDASRRGDTDLVLWEPPERPDGSGTRRTAASETADLLADLVGGQRAVPGVRALAPRSRGGGADLPSVAGEDRPLAGRTGGRLPRGRPARGPPRARGGTCGRGDCSGWPAPTRSSWESTSRDSTRC